MFGRSRSFVLLAVFALALLAAFAPVANARAAGSCVKKGERVSKLSHGALQVSRPLTATTWEPGTGFARYFCSRKYGTRVYMGDFGITASGAKDISVLADGPQFVAVVSGSAGNGGFESHGLVRVVDLKRGKIVTSVPGFQMNEPFVITKLVMSAAGWIGWTAQEYYDESKDGRIVQVLSAKAGGSARLLAAGTQIDPLFLRFDRDHRTLIWAEPFGAAKRTPRSVSNPTVRASSKRCLKKDEKALVRQSGSVLIKRPINRRDWKNAYQLIGCSGGTKVRHVIGTFGDADVEPKRSTPLKYEVEKTSMNSRFAAVLVRRSSKDPELNLDYILVFDLKLGRLVSKTATSPVEGPVSDPRPPTDPPFTHRYSDVTNVEVSTDGSVAWIARYAPLSGSGKGNYVVNMLDGEFPKVLAHGAAIDPYFLRFSDWRDPSGGIRWAEKAGRGKAQ